jgi:competence protein ComEC
MVIVVLYALFVGGSPSVLRAAVMGEVMLGATLAGRPGSALGALALTGALLTAAQPSIIDEVAFQLSFAATLGIVLLATPLQERLASRWPLLPHLLVVEPLSVTLAATLAVLPITAATFGSVSLVALPANLLALPLFPFVLAGSLVVALVGTIAAPVALALAGVAYLPLTALVRIADLFSELPGASLRLSGVGLLGVVLAYAVVGTLALWLRRSGYSRAEAPTPRRRFSPALAGALALAVLAVPVWSQTLRPEADRLRVSVLDVGQGDAILIQTPAGQRILVDGGPSGSRLLQALGRELAPDSRGLDLVVLTHGQDDHVAGLVDLLERIQVGALLESPLRGETAANRAFRAAVEAHAIPTVIASAGQWADLGQGLMLEVLNPQPELVQGSVDDLNNNCIVLRLLYGEVSFLLTCDIAAEGEQALLASGADLRASVLKVGHHGSDDSSTPAFLAAVQAGVAVVSSGASNAYGHPSPTTLLRLAGLPLLRTDANGSVRFETDGRRLWLEPQRGDARVVRLAGE